jgi:predicted TIM-barrel fold metal-dependent hydrolase
MTIIDSHCHAGQGVTGSDPSSTKGSFRRYLQRAREAGISRTVIFAGFHPNYAVANQEIGRLVLREPDRFDGYAFVHSGRDRGEVWRIVSEGVLQFHFRGIKVHRRDAPITREICMVARSFGLPVLYDIMGEVADCHRLARLFPDINFIIPHLGSFTDDLQAQLAVIQCLVQYPNLYADTAGVRHFDLLERAVQEAGPEKILFGSDGPWLHPGVELYRIESLRLTKRESALILSQNYLRLTQGQFGWDAKATSPRGVNLGRSPDGLEGMSDGGFHGHEPHVSFAMHDH